MLLLNGIHYERCVCYRPQTKFGMGWGGHGWVRSRGGVCVWLGGACVAEDPPPQYGWPAGGAQPTGMMPCYFGLNFVELCLFRKKETALFM